MSGRNHAATTNDAQRISLPFTNKGVVDGLPELRAGASFFECIGETQAMLWRYSLQSV
jgi:hypothetical protein